MIEIKKTIYGLIGFPVKHSLSAVMHNAAFRKLGIDAEYRLFEVAPENLAGFISSLRQNNISGLNVTIPHKEKIIPFLDRLSGEAELIAAVNTIKVLQDRLEGHNTDGQGFIKHLSYGLGFGPSGKKISIIGAGGAARAVTVSLAKAGAEKIAVYDIDAAKVVTLAGHLEKNFKETKFYAADSIAGLDIGESDLLINASANGMKASDPCLVENGFHKDLLVYDLIYNPKETKLLKAAKEKGARVSNGLGMLLYQGMVSFEIWTGEKAPKEIMQKAINEGVNKL